MRLMSSIEVRESPVHGRGVFATKRIRKGQCIIEYTGRRVPWTDIPDDVDETHTFLFGINDGEEVIDPQVGGNEARWINHSCEPNCEAIEEADGRVFIHALRNLSRGKSSFTITSWKLTSRSQPRQRQSQSAVVEALSVAAICSKRSRQNTFSGTRELRPRLQDISNA